MMANHSAFIFTAGVAVGVCLLALAIGGTFILEMARSAFCE